MGTQKLPGSHLLAALHAGMERMKTCAKVCRAASKKPQNRSNLDINHILGETQAVQLLSQHGPGVHRDLCHVVHHCSLSQMSSFRLPGEHPHGLFIYVMQGRIQLRTRNQFKAALNSENSSGSSEPGGRTTAGGSAGDGSGGAAGASDADLRALFDSIDVDGSGAIDVEELQYALEVMGIQKTAADVQELMDSVDKDGSGELEFDEFVLILTTKLGVGRQQQSTWQELGDGGWALEVGQGACVGGAALTQGLAQEGLVVAVDDSDLLLLDGNVYQSILSTGFDGQLTAKMNILRSCPVLNSSLSSRSDLRGLAYVATAETYSWGSKVYSAGQPCQRGALYVIHEGGCRVVGKLRSPGPAPTTAAAAALLAATAADAVAAASAGPTGSRAVADSPAAAAWLLSPRHGLRSPRTRVTEQQVELAVVGHGDILGEGALLGLSTHASSAVVSSAHLSVLKLQLSDMQQLMHPADMQSLREALLERDAGRSQRLTAAGATASTLQVQQQHVRGVAAAVAAAAAAGGASDELLATSSLLQQGGQTVKRESMPSAWQEPGSPRDGCKSARAAVSASGGNGAGGMSMSGEQAMRRLLPSSGAAAAVAIAARGDVHIENLPSRVAKAEADAVAQLLTDLVGAKEDMQAAQEAVIAATAAALAAAGRMSAAPAANELVTGAGPGCSAASSVKLPAQSAPGCVRQHSTLRSAAGGAARAAGATATDFASAPGAIAGAPGLQQQQQQPFTAAHTLLPDRLVAKLQHAVSTSQPGRSPTHSSKQGQQHNMPPSPLYRSATLPATTITSNSSCSSSPASPYAAGPRSFRSRTDGGSSSKYNDNTTPVCCSGSSSGSLPGYSALLGADPATGSIDRTPPAGAGSATAAALDGGPEVQHRSACSRHRRRGSQSRTLLPQSKPSSPLNPKGVKRGLAVSGACHTNQPDAFFLQTGSGGCVGAGMQGLTGRQEAGSPMQQPQQLPGQSQLQESCSAEVAAAVSSCLQGEQQLYVLEGCCHGAGPVGLPVATPEAISAAQQQLATCSISLPTPRSSRHRRSTASASVTPRSAAAAVAVVSVALTAEAAAAGAAASSTPAGLWGSAAGNAAWPACPSRQLTTSGGLRGQTAGGGVSSRGGACGSWSGQPHRDSAAAAVCLSSRGGSAAPPFSVYCGSSSSSAGRLQRFSTAGGAALRDTSPPGNGIDQPAGSCAGVVNPPQSQHQISSLECGVSARVRGGSGAGVKEGTEGAAAAAVPCSAARPVPGGMFVELDGPAWVAAESAADAASWCLSSRGSWTHRQHTRLEPCMEQQLPLQRQQQPQVVASRVEGVQAAGGTAVTAALIAAAQDLLSQPLLLGGSCHAARRPAGASTTAAQPTLHQVGEAQLGPCANQHAAKCVTGEQDLAPGQLAAATPAGLALCPAHKPQAASAAVLSRPKTVPKLQLAKLQLAFGDCSTARATDSTARGWSGASAAAGSSCRTSVGNGSSSEPAAGSCQAQEQQQPAVMPSMLPAFTPRRIWAPGGSRSSQGGAASSRGI